MGSGGRCGFAKLVASFCRMLCDDRLNASFVTRRSFGWSGCRSPDRPRRQLLDREKNDKFGALTNPAVDLDPPPVIGNDSVDDRKPEPGALTDIFCRKEWLEYSILRFGIHAAAGIGDTEANEISAGGAPRMPARRRNGD